MFVYNLGDVRLHDSQVGCHVDEHPRSLDAEFRLERRPQVDKHCMYCYNLPT